MHGNGYGPILFNITREIQIEYDVLAAYTCHFLHGNGLQFVTYHSPGHLSTSRLIAIDDGDHKSVYMHCTSTTSEHFRSQICK